MKYDAEAAAEAEARWEAAQGRTRSGRMARAAVDADAPSAAHEQPIDSADEAAERSRPAQSASEAPPGSLRTLDADLAAMHKASLGQLLLPPEGSGALKAAVMGMLRGNVNHPPKHNKYSGIQVRLTRIVWRRVRISICAAAARTLDVSRASVWEPDAAPAREQVWVVTKPPRAAREQEWRNAVTLFVNVCGKTGSVYPNLFSKGGRQMAWFAQPSQTIASPVIHRMLVEDPTSARPSSPAKVSAKVKLEDPTAGGTTCPVLLFCRQEGEPYVYAGRLRCGHDLTTTHVYVCMPRLVHVHV